MPIAGREVLEVVFDGQLRRLSAQREWEIILPQAPEASVARSESAGSGVALRRAISCSSCGSRSERVAGGDVRSARRVGALGGLGRAPIG